jgi:phage terminase large subunit-like protein
VISARALERVTPEMRGLVDVAIRLGTLSARRRAELVAGLSPTTRQALRDLKWEWPVWARENQLAPEAPWRWWVMTGGRGSGKTRSAAEQVITWAKTQPGCRIAMVGSDAGNVRKVMLNGQSGILTRAPRWFQPRWWKTDKLVEWPNGSICELHTSEEPRTLRGPQFHYAWLEELFHWTIPRGEREPIAWREGIKFGLRLGDHPQGIVTSTPRASEFCHDMLLGKKDDDGKRAVGREEIDSGEWSLEQMVEDPETGEEHRFRIVVSRWSSEENKANLSPGVIAEWRQELKGTRLERQELDGDILAKVEGALWSTEGLDFCRVPGVPGRIAKTLVALDPTRSDAPVDEAGIIVGGLGEDGHAYVWEDASMSGSPWAWARAAVDARNRSGAGAIVYEQNRLGDKARQTIRAVDTGGGRWVPVQALDGKRTRAEPVSALYEAGRVHHVGDKLKFARLEDEMISWDPRAKMPSPNRMDALVWLITALLLSDRPELKHL